MAGRVEVDLVVDLASVASGWDLRGSLVEGCLLGSTKRQSVAEQSCLVDESCADWVVEL